MKVIHVLHKAGLTVAASVVLFAAVPLVALAAPTFRDLTVIFIGITNQLILLLCGVAVLVFFWGIVKYLFSPGGEGYEEGRKMMFWGVIGLFVLFGMFGLTQVFTKLIRGDAGSAGTATGGTQSTSGTITVTPLPPP